MGQLVNKLKKIKLFFFTHAFQRSFKTNLLPCSEFHQTYGWVNKVAIISQGLLPMGENNQNYKLLASGEVILTTKVHPIKSTYSL